MSLDINSIKQQAISNKQRQDKLNTDYKASILRYYNLAQPIMIEKLANMIESTLKHRVDGFYSVDIGAFKKTGLFGNTYKTTITLYSTKLRTHDKDLLTNRDITSHLAVVNIPNKYGECSDEIFICPTTRFMNELVTGIKHRLSEYNCTIRLTQSSKFESHLGEIYKWDTYNIHATLTVQL